ncbi:MAG: hypothetical protein ACLTK8_00590 [Paeniclostridium sp.]
MKVLRDKNDTWIGTDGGLAYYDEEEEHSIYIEIRFMIKIV